KTYRTSKNQPSSNRFHEAAEVISTQSLLPRLGKLLRLRQLDRHELADPAFGHGDAEQAVHARHGDGVVGDGDETGVGALAHGLEEVAEALDIVVLERIIGFDQLQLSLAALEQGRKQILEMVVDDVESGDEPLAPLLIEGANRAAQALDRFGQIVALGDELVAACPNLNEFVVRAQVDRAEPLALPAQILEP